MDVSSCTPHPTGVSRNSSDFVDVLKVCSTTWHEETLASIQAVLQGRDVPGSGYDSDDDPESLVNRRIQARKMAYCCTVLQYWYNRDGSLPVVVVTERSS